MCLHLKKNKYIWHRTIHRHITIWKSHWKNASIKKTNWKYFLCNIIRAQKSPGIEQVSIPKSPSLNTFRFFCFNSGVQTKPKALSKAAGLRKQMTVECMQNTGFVYANIVYIYIPSERVHTISEHYKNE